ncbi:zinc ribbon domain-containing protein [Oscillospiraceae bacterium PP1C4]
MGKFDELFLRAKDLAKAAGNKTEEVVELTRLHLQASQLKSEIDANYLKLGEIIYELNKAGVENETLINMCIAEIESQLKELEELNAKIDKMKNVLKCPECMAANPVGALFCSRCGASLKDQPVTQESAEDVAVAAQVEDMKQE